METEKRTRLISMEEIEELEKVNTRTVMSSVYKLGNKYESQHSMLTFEPDSVVSENPSEGRVPNPSFDALYNYLLPHQQKELTWLASKAEGSKEIPLHPVLKKNRGGGCVFYEQGTGKTMLLVTWIIDRLLHMKGGKEVWRMLLVMKENCIAAWKSEFAVAANLSGVSFRVCLVSSTTPVEAMRSADICIVGPDMLSSFWRRAHGAPNFSPLLFQQAQLMKSRGKHVKVQKRGAGPLEQFFFTPGNFYARIVDEADYLRNAMKADYWPSLDVVFSKVCFLLTGTPIHTRAASNLGSLFTLIGVPEVALRNNMNAVREELSRAKTMKELAREYPDVEMLQLPPLERCVMLMDFAHPEEQALYDSLYSKTQRVVEEYQRLDEGASGRQLAMKYDMAVRNNMLAMRQVCCGAKALGIGLQKKKEECGDLDAEVNPELLQKLLESPMFSTDSTKVRMIVDYCKRYCRVGERTREDSEVQKNSSFYVTDQCEEEEEEEDSGEEEEEEEEALTVTKKRKIEGDVSPEKQQQQQQQEVHDNVVIFTEWKRSQMILKEALEKAGFDLVVCYNGGMSKQEKRQALHTAMTDDRCRVFLVTVGAGSSSLNLQEKFNRVGFDTSMYDPQVYLQAMKRVHRINKNRRRRWLTDHVVVTWFMIRSVEVKIFELARDREEMARNFLRHGSTNKVAVNARTFLRDFTPDQISKVERRMQAVGGFGQSKEARHSASDIFKDIFGGTGGTSSKMAGVGEHNLIDEERMRKEEKQVAEKQKAEERGMHLALGSVLKQLCSERQADKLECMFQLALYYNGTVCKLNQKTPCLLLNLGAAPPGRRKFRIHMIRANRIKPDAKFVRFQNRREFVTRLKKEKSLSGSIFLMSGVEGIAQHLSDAYDMLPEAEKQIAPYAILLEQEKMVFCFSPGLFLEDR